MKKILFVLPSLTVGGMEKMLVTLANRLTACGYARIPELQGVEKLPNGVNAHYMWRHPNGSYATLHIVILK